MKSSKRLKGEAAKQLDHRERSKTISLLYWYWKTQRILPVYHFWVQWIRIHRHRRMPSQIELSSFEQSITPTTSILIQLNASSYLIRITTCCPSISKITRVHNEHPLFYRVWIDLSRQRLHFQLQLKPFLLLQMNESLNNSNVATSFLLLHSSS